MNMMNKYAMFGCLLLLGLCACNDEQEEGLGLNYDYFPLAIGQSSTYQVDSTILDFNGNQKIRLYSSTRIIQEVVDTFIDLEGQTNYIIFNHESGLDSNNLNYSGTKVGSARIVDRRLERVEDNFRTIPMVFPPNIGTQWNPTLFINETQEITVAGENIKAFKNWSAEIIDYQDSELVGGNIYEDVITIILADDENALERRYVTAKYAKNIGLVYKKMMIIDTQDIESNEDWETKGDKGFILEQHLIL